MNRTKGEKNKARFEDWDLFKKDVLSISGKAIIKNNSKPSPSYSYSPSEICYSFESETDVCIHLHSKYCLLLFNKPDYKQPGSYQPYR